MTFQSLDDLVICDILGVDTNSNHWYLKQPDLIYAQANLTLNNNYTSFLAIRYPSGTLCVLSRQVLLSVITF